MQSMWMRPLAACIGIALLVASSFALGHALAARGVIGDVFGPGSASERVALVREALATPNELTRAETLAPLLQSIQPAELPDIVGAYEATFPGFGPGKVAMQLLCERWAQIDPRGAAQHIGGWTRYWREMALPFLMRSWARRDAVTAREVLEAADLGPEPRKVATAALLEGWAQSGDPGVWGDYVAGLPFGYDAALEFMSEFAAYQGLDVLEDRVEALPDESGDGFKRRALQILVMLAVRGEPEFALSVAERHADTPTGRGLRMTLAMQWVVRDGPSTLDWLLALPAEMELEHTVRSAYQRWLAMDALGALEWALDEPAPRRAAFLDLYAVALADRDPQQAAELAESVASEKRRSAALTKVAKNWHSQNPAAALLWFEERGLANVLPAPGRRAGGAARGVPVPRLGRGKAEDE